MKTLIPILMFFLASSAGAASEMERIHKDVTVMAKIIDGAFEADDSCDNCDPSIRTSYLTDQGVVFTIKANSWKSFHLGHDGEGYSFVIPGPEQPEGVRKIEITKMVGDILDDVGVVMDEVGSHIELSLSDLDPSVVRMDSEARRAIRDLNRERRELEYQRREYEIELIHADDKERQRIEGRIQQLENQITALEANHGELREELELAQQRKEKAREARRDKIRQEAEAQRTLVEDIVFLSLCDYGATLKNIPRDEHVSLIFETRDGSQQQVFVIEKSDIDNCKSAASLKSGATQYTF